MKVTSEELWLRLEPKFIDLRNMYLEEIFTLKIDEILNKMNSSMVGGYVEANLELIMTFEEVIKSDAIYRKNMNLEKNKEKIQSLSDELVMFRKLLINEIREKRQADNMIKPTSESKRLPNIDDDKIAKMYQDIK